MSFSAEALDGLTPAGRDEMRRLEDRLARLEAMYAAGYGTPEGVVPGRKGRLFHRLDGGAGSCVYVFEGTDGSVTGWVAK